MEATLVRKRRKSATPIKVKARRNITKRRKGPEEIDVEIPVRLLHVVGIAAKEDGKYAMSGVLIETNEAKALVSAIATDGRSLIIADRVRGIFDDDISLIVPKLIARNAARIAIARPQDDQTGALVTLTRKGQKCHLTAYTVEGPVVFEWKLDPKAKFPPFRDAIPNFQKEPGVGRIGITPDLVGVTLHVMQKVVGKEPLVKVYLPTAADKPIGFESQDGDSIKVLAVVMPASIEEWVEKPAPAEAEKKDGEEHAPPLPFEDDSWKRVPLSELGLSARIIKALNEHEPRIFMLGQLGAWQEKKADFWAKDIKGLGDKGREEIENAQLTYWQAHPREVAAKPEASQQPAASSNGDGSNGDGHATTDRK